MFSYTVTSCFNRTFFLASQSLVITIQFLSTYMLVISLYSLTTTLTISCDSICCHSTRLFSVFSVTMAAAFLQLVEMEAGSPSYTASHTSISLFQRIPRIVQLACGRPTFLGVVYALSCCVYIYKLCAICDLQLSVLVWITLAPPYWNSFTRTSPSCESGGYKWETSLRMSGHTSLYNACSTY